MNLGKLLGAGKTFINGGKSAAYRLDKRVYVPQFISPKNPFANTPGLPAQAEHPKLETPNSAAAIQKPKPTWLKTEKIQTPIPTPAPAGPAGPARATAWASKFNPVSMFREAMPGANKNSTPVQAELSLEKVKVVHNDLTDAEVEVVPMKSRPAKAPESDGMPAKKTWSDLGERILRATAL